MYHGTDAADSPMDRPATYEDLLTVPDTMVAEIVDDEARSDRSHQADHDARPRSFRHQEAVHPTG